MPSPPGHLNRPAPPHRRTLVARQIAGLMLAPRFDATSVSGSLAAPAGTPGGGTVVLHYA